MNRQNRLTIRIPFLVQASADGTLAIAAAVAIIIAILVC